MTLTEETLADKDLPSKLYDQMKYYFSDYNLSRDKFLVSQIEESPEKSVKLSILATFNRLSQLAKDPKIIADTLINYINKNKDEQPFVLVDSVTLTVKRNYDVFPVPENLKLYAEQLHKDNNVYVKGFPKGITLEELNEYFESNFGPVLNIFKRFYLVGDKKANSLAVSHANSTTNEGTNNSSHSLESLGFMKKVKNGMRFFKGSVFVTFKNASDAEKLVNAPLPLKYKDNELIKSYQHVYEAEKGIDLNKKKSYTSSNPSDPKDPVENEGELIKSRVAQVIQKGNVLQIKGFDPSDGKNNRHSLKESFDHYGKVAWIDFEPGNTEAFVRFTGQENVASLVLDKMKAIKIDDTTTTIIEKDDNAEKVGPKYDWNLKLGENSPLTLEARILEGDEEFDYWVGIVTQILKSGNRDQNFSRKKKGKKGKQHQQQFKGGKRSKDANTTTTDTNNSSRTKRKLDNLSSKNDSTENVVSSSSNEPTNKTSKIEN